MCIVLGCVPQADIYTKGLNRKGGDNVFRFDNFKDRVAMVDVNDAQKIKGEVDLEALPSGGLTGSFFKDELYRLIELDISKPFLAFHRSMSAKCQTMAQVLHHRKELVDLLLASLQDVQQALCWRSLLALVSALAKWVPKQSANRFSCSVPHTTPPCHAQRAWVQPRKVWVIELPCMRCAP